MLLPTTCLFPGLPGKVTVLKTGIAIDSDTTNGSRKESEVEKTLMWIHLTGQQTFRCGLLSAGQCVTCSLLYAVILNTSLSEKSKELEKMCLIISLSKDY
jgi:hypothetical protein